MALQAETMERRFGTQGERRERAHTKLIEATIELIAERGLQGFSLSDVGLRAGVSRTLPGHHFRSRAELLHKAVERVFDPGPERVDFGLHHMLDAVRVKLTEAAKRTSISLALTQLVASRLPKDLATLRDRYRESWRASITRHLEMALILGQARPDLDPDAVAPVLIGQIHAEVMRLGIEQGSTEIFLDLLARAVARAEPPGATRGARASQPAPAKKQNQGNLFGD